MVVVIPHVPHVPAPPSKRAQHVRDNVVELVKILREKDPKISDADVLSGVQLALASLRAGSRAGVKALQQLTIALWLVYGVVAGVLVASGELNAGIKIYLMLMAAFNALITVVWLIARKRAPAQ